MTAPVPAPRSRHIILAAWRIAIAMLPLGAGLAIAAILLPTAHDPSASITVATRIATGVVLSVVTLVVVALLVRWEGRGRLSEAGLTSFRTGWRLAVWGAIVWTVPAALAFGVLALLGSPLSVAVPVMDLLGTVTLLMVAVLLAEAIPEEVVFRGYITTTLGTVTRGWGIIVIQAALFTLFAAVLRQNAHLADLSLFLTMGIGFGYLRMITGSVWMPIGFHTAFQTGAQLVLTHGAVTFAGGTGAAMLALGVIPFATAAVLVSAAGIPRRIAPGVPS